MTPARRFGAAEAPFGSRTGRYGRAIGSGTTSRDTTRRVGAISWVVIVSVTTLVVGASMSAAGARGATIPTPTMLPTTSVAPVGDLVDGLSATLEVAAGLTVVPANLRPSLPDARQGVSAVYSNGCHVSTFAVEPLVCNHGDVDGSYEVVLVGDSHAAHWFPAVDLLARESGTLVLADTPIASSDVPTCVWQHLVDVDDCSRPRADAFAHRLTEVEQGAAADAGVRYIQADDLLCGPTRCPVIVGDILVYLDQAHVTAEYMTWVAPALAPLLGGPWRSPG